MLAIGEKSQSESVVVLKSPRKAEEGSPRFHRPPKPHAYVSMPLQSSLGFKSFLSMLKNLPFLITWSDLLFYSNLWLIYIYIKSPINTILYSNLASPLVAFFIALLISITISRLFRILFFNNIYKYKSLEILHTSILDTSLVNFTLYNGLVKMFMIGQILRAEAQYQTMPNLGPSQVQKIKQRKEFLVKYKSSLNRINKFELISSAMARDQNNDEFHKHLLVIFTTHANECKKELTKIDKELDDLRWFYWGTGNVNSVDF